MLMILAIDGGRGRFWTKPETQGRSVPGKLRSADIPHRVRASGFRYGRFKAVIRSGPRFRASRACGKGVKGGLRVHDWHRTSPPEGLLCSPEAGFRSTRGRSAADSGGPTDWRTFATRFQA